MGFGSPTVPLWLPYVVFTVVLLSLIVVSFARFHALRGAQYRNSSTHLDTPRLTWTHLDTPRFHALRGAQYRNSSIHLDTPRLTWTHLDTPGHTSIPRPARSSVPQQLDSPGYTPTHLDTPGHTSIPRPARSTVPQQTAGRRTDIRTQRAQERVGLTHYQSINQSCIFRVVQVIKLLQDPLEVGNNLPGINDNVRERGLEQKCFFKRCRKIVYTNGEF